MQKRVVFIDIAKGLGILLVVLAHNDLQAYAPFVHKIIYSFHMPLFFFLSGMFFKPEITLKDLLRRRFDSLLKPYFFTILMIYFAAVFFDNMGFPVALSRMLKSLYANGFYLDWVAMWFLPALFTTNLVAFAFYKLLPPSQNHGLRWLALAGLLVLGIWTLPWFMPFQLALFGRSLPLNGLPWSLDLALLAGFFFILGRESYQHLPETAFSSPITLLVSAALSLGLLLFSPALVDLNTRQWDSPLINSLEALSGIAFILAFSSLLGRGPAWLVNLFSYLGRISVVILIFHNPVQSYLTPKIDALIGLHPFNPLLAFPFAVLAPVIIYEVFIRQNALTSSLYGLKSK